MKLKNLKIFILIFVLLLNGIFASCENKDENINALMIRTLEILELDGGEKNEYKIFNTKSEFDNFFDDYETEKFSDKNLADIDLSRFDSVFFEGKNLIVVHSPNERIDDVKSSIKYYNIEASEMTIYIEAVHYGDTRIDLGEYYFFLEIDKNKMKDVEKVIIINNIITEE